MGGTVEGLKERIGRELRRQLRDALASCMSAELYSREGTLRLIVEAWLRAARPQLVPAGLFVVSRPSEGLTIPGRSLMVDPFQPLEHRRTQQIELQVFRHVDEGAVLFAWGPLSLGHVTIGPQSVAQRGQAFAVLPAIGVGQVITVEVEAWAL